MSSALPQVGAIARRSVVRTSRQPASIIPPLVFPVVLMAVNTGGLRASTELPGFPTESFLAFALAVPFIQGALFSTMNAGTDLARDIQTGFVNRLSLTALRDSALLVGQLAGVVVLGLVQVLFYLVVGLSAGVRGACCALLRRARRVARIQDGVRRDDPGALPGSLRVPVHLVDEHPPQPHRSRLVPGRGDAEPGLVHDRVRPQPHHHGLGLASAGARLRVRRRSRARLADPRFTRASDEADEDVARCGPGTSCQELRGGR